MREVDRGAQEKVRLFSVAPYARNTNAFCKKQDKKAVTGRGQKTGDLSIQAKARQQPAQPKVKR
jgi:hypothetical protein